ncbi:MAG: PD-(D/E)XK nuclease family transposase [Fibrobacter sp.]|nr:PD-(D/E)XK nuclease family transposase [Fibrobacter sp.]
MPSQKTANTFAHNESPKTEIASLLADCAFKYVYTRDNPKSRENLRQLMSTLIGKKLQKAEPLVTETFASTQPKTEKTSRFDVRVVMDDGDEADVEVQLWTEKDDYAKRLSYYGAKLYASQAAKGAKYKELNKCYQIIISQDCIFPNTSWLLNLDISAQENRMFKFDTMHWCIIQLNFLKQAIRENVGRNDEYLQNLLDLCKFIAKPTRVKPFENVYEDLMAFSAEQIEAYRKEMEERRRLDAISTRKYTEELIAEQEKEIAEQKQEIAAIKQEAAEKDRIIAELKAKLAAQ